MAKPPVATTSEIPPADPLAAQIVRIDGLVEGLAGLTARLDDMAEVLAGLPTRDAFNLTERGFQQLREDYPRLAAGMDNLRQDQAELRQDVADLQAGGVVAHLVGETGPALGAVRELREGVIGVDLARVTHAEAADALGIAIDQVFSAKRRADGRVGVVTVDGRKLIEGEHRGGDQADAQGGGE